MPISNNVALKLKVALANTHPAVTSNKLPVRIFAGAEEKMSPNPPHTQLEKTDPFLYIYLFIIKLYFFCDRDVIKYIFSYKSLTLN